jgi:nitrogen-specific signal transduction histidine kinase
MNKVEFEAFNSLNTEIIILNAQDFSLLWLNDSAKAANWITDPSINDTGDIFSMLDEPAAEQIKELLTQAKKNASSITRRDFMIGEHSEQLRTLDLTVTYSEKKDLIYIEALNTENLNKIIDSTRSFASQKIAAGLFRC